MDHEQMPPLTLQAATLTVRELGEVTIFRDWCWASDIGYWVLHCSLRADIRMGGPVPAKTKWYVLVSPAYPRGPILFFPAKTGGLKKIFRHQPFKSFGKDKQDKLPWIPFYMCLDTHVRILGLHSGDDEPYDYRDRLEWRFKRALDWLNAASHGRLGKVGDPFELPFTVASVGTKVIFSENETSYELWKDAPRSGYVQFSMLQEEPLTLVTKQFTTMDGKAVCTPPWGSKIGNLPDHNESAIWLRLDEVPVLAPWQAAKSWSQLLRICKQQGIDLIRSIWPMLKEREGQGLVPLMIGYPVPEKIGEDLKQHHWQLLYLPPTKPIYHRKGYRVHKGQEGYAKSGLRGSIAWARSENWSPNQLGTRGQLAPEAVIQHIVQIGGGSLGSSLAESLVRSGLRRFSLIDGDIFVAGNTVRHTLGIDDVGNPKVKGLTERLNNIAPHVIADGVSKHLQFIKPEELERIASAQVFLDCTGEDDALRFLEDLVWNKPKRYISVSTGMKAKRLYIYTCYSKRFQLDDFERSIAPWLDLERDEFPDQELRWEGVGCYYPIMEARQDDLYIWAGVATKHIEQILIDDQSGAQLWVWEQHSVNDMISIGPTSLPKESKDIRSSRLRDQARSESKSSSLSDAPLRRTNQNER